MTKLDDNGKRELIEKLQLTQRRIDQLIDQGVLVTSGDDRFNIELNVRRYEAFRDRDFDYVEFEVRDASDALQHGFQLLRAAPTTQKRRAIAVRENFGPQIGRLDRANLLMIAMAPEAHRGILKMTLNNHIGQLVTDFSELLGS